MPLKKISIHYSNKPVNRNGMPLPGHESHDQQLKNRLDSNAHKNFLRS